MNTHAQAVICLFNSWCRFAIHSKSKQQHTESPDYGSGERWSPFPETALGADPKAFHSLAVCDTTCGNLLYFPPFKDFEFLIYQEAFPVSFMKSLCQHGNNSNHLRLFFPCSLFLLQCDETGLVSFPFLNRQIHFLIFSHAQHSKKTAHKGDQNTSLKPFLLFFFLTVLQLFLFSFSFSIMELLSQN